MPRGIFILYSAAVATVFQRNVDALGGIYMQVNVFVTRGIEAEQYKLLVIPYGEHSAIPVELQHLTWRHLATTRMDDRLLALSEPVIRAQMDMIGYGLINLAP